MEKRKVDYLSKETLRLHDKLTEVYELGCDNEDDKARDVIDELRKDLMEMKKSLTKS